MATKRRPRRTNQRKRGASEARENNISLADLRREWRQRERNVRTLLRTRHRLAERIAALEAEITALGGTTPGRRRPRNTMKLSDALARTLKGNPLSVTNAAEAVRRDGYATTSPNFRTIVNQTLINDKRFKRVSRGIYVAQ